MHGPPLTINEIAARFARDVAGFRRLGIALSPAINVVAERHHVPPTIVTRLVLQHRLREKLQADEREAAA